MTDSQHVLALFGAGRMGTTHFRNLQGSTRARVKWLVEDDAFVGKAQDVIKSLGVEHVVRVVSLSDVSKVYDDEEVEAVLICTPVATHGDLVKASLKAGKAVFCEKPLAPAESEIVECYEAAEKTGKPLMCGFNRRFDPTHRNVYNATRQEDLGRIRVVRSISRDPPAMMTKEYLLASGGIFLDSAIHDIDMLCWMTGESPETVYAAGHAAIPLYAACGDIDTCAVTLKFPGGAVGQIEVSREAPIGNDQRVEVLCEKALLKSENKRPNEMVRWDMRGSTADLIYVQGIERYSESYHNEIQHFLDVLDGRPLEVTRDQTVAVSRTVQACKDSYRTGQVIRLS